MSETTPGQAAFTWDYRQPAPIDEIAAAVRELSGGTVTMTMPDTGSDQYELVITRRSAGQQLAYDQDREAEEIAAEDDVFTADAASLDSDFDDDGERDTARRMDALDEAARLEAGQ